MAKTNKELQREYSDRMRALDCVPTTMWVPKESKSDIRTQVKKITDDYLMERRDNESS